MTEVSYLILSVGLFFVMILVQSLMGMKHYGLVPLAGARDELGAPGVMVERAKRANANMIEAMIMFVPLILIAIHTGTVGGNVLLGATLFFWGRAAYAVLYWAGVPWLRTIAWGISIAGILRIFVSLLPLI